MFLYNIENLILPKVGCGSGGMNWELIVKPAIKQYCNENKNIPWPKTIKIVY